MLGRIAAVAAPDRPELRASIAASQVVGLAMARYVVRLEPVASATADELAPVLGATVQRYLAGDL